MWPCLSSLPLSPPLVGAGGCVGCLPEDRDGEADSMPELLYFPVLHMRSAQLQSVPPGPSRVSPVSVATALQALHSTLPACLAFHLGHGLPLAVLPLHWQFLEWPSAVLLGTCHHVCLRQGTRPHRQRSLSSEGASWPRLPLPNSWSIDTLQGQAPREATLWSTAGAPVVRSRGSSTICVAQGGMKSQAPAQKVSLSRQHRAFKVSSKHC